ncbi:FMN reductase [Spongisporangium articulatum]|uniref:FMN reductase n=1 Tax=Spongisporangium articulatum TaxID=3362603 RepID=A0ABW8AJB4_9ACTN
MTSRSLVVVSAGLTQPSSTRLLADRLTEATVSALRSRGVEVSVRVVEAREVAHDVVNNLLTGFAPAALQAVLDAVVAADGVIAVTPTFNASFSGLFKSLFDVLPDQALADKPVLLGATGGTARHSLVLEHALRPMFSYMHAAPVGTAVYAATEDWAGSDGGSAPGLEHRIDRAAAELADAMLRRDPAEVADPFALTTSFKDLLGE